MESFKRVTLTTKVSLRGVFAASREPTEKEYCVHKERRQSQNRQRKEAKKREARKRSRAARKVDGKTGGG
jgi:hypothetical protein